jgi:hypothetical protein
MMAIGGRIVTNLDDLEGVIGQTRAVSEFFSAQAMSSRKLKRQLRAIKNALENYIRYGIEAKSSRLSDSELE